jgi:fructosamine-3-kinase
MKSNADGSTSDAAAGGLAAGIFRKRNAGGHPDQLVCEAAGLEALRAAAAGSGIDVPQVLHVDAQSLTMTRIRAAAWTEDAWARLGAGLARIHAAANPRFGFARDNYLGLSPQANGFDESWGRFFLCRRLAFQVARIGDARLRRRCEQHLAQRSDRLCAFLDGERVSPSLVHGDLWNGNVLCGQDGRVWLIDPAPYYADADVDLAMTQLFGGFGPAFYAAYRGVRPEPPRYALKRRIYNLYHYLNHLNLFGAAYLPGCEDGWAALDEL